MSAHTPGPWRVKGSARNLILRIFAGDHDDIDTEIATVFRTDHLDYQADARLIAAAPELLDALRAFCGDYESTPTTGDTSLKAAYLHALVVIAKAAPE